MALYIANAIKKATTTYNTDGTENTNLMANTMAHTVAGTDISNLTESQKQTVSALSQMAA